MITKSIVVCMTISLDNLIEATGWGIVHSLWIGAVVYGLLLLLFAAFPDTRARTRHAMAFSSLGLLFMGFLTIFLDRLDISFGNTDPNGVPTDFPAVMQVFFDAESPSVPFFRYLVGGYFAGFCLQTLLLALGYIRVRRIRNSGLLPVPEAWKTIFDQTLLRMGIGRHVGLWLSENVKMPLVVGYLKPVVLFPLALSSHLDVDQVEAILIHELSHIRRNDYLLNLLKTMIEAVLFFNPFVWLLGRIINDERENACDDDVLEQTGNPIFYAQTLLRVALLAEGSGCGLAMTATPKKPSQLFQRIKRITAMKTNYRNVRQQLWVLAFSLLASASLAWIGPKETTDIPDQGQPDTVEPTPTDWKQVIADTVQPLKFDKARIDTFRNGVQQRGKSEIDDVEFRAIPSELEMDTVVFKASPKMEVSRDSQRVLHRKALKLDSLDKTIQLVLAQRKAIDMDSLNRMVATRVALNDSIAMRIDSLFSSKQFVFSTKLSFNMDSLATTIFPPHFKDWELYQSPEYQALRKDFEKKVEKLRRKREHSN